MQLNSAQCLFLLLTVFIINVADADSSGICNNTKFVTKSRFVIDRTKGVWDKQNYQSPVLVEECCEGYKPSPDTTPGRAPNYCTPVCEPECEKADCVSPNTCVCYKGHALINNSSSSCYDVCDSCVYGKCNLNEVECTCNIGYAKDEHTKHICNPICSPSCVNATCSAPNTCDCLNGFTNESGVQSNICVPKCTEACEFGMCTAPNECTCFGGYITDKESPSICLPVCNHTCEKNSYCSRPNTCTCRDGFTAHPKTPFRCIPDPPENSVLRFCELNMHKAVKYDSDRECLMIKDKVTISGDRFCQTLGSLSQPICSQHNACSINNCILNFRCSAQHLNGSSEIHCDLENDDFETDMGRNVSIADIEWSDVSLVINSLHSINMSLVETEEQNQTQKWCLHPLNKLPVCKGDYFAVEICPCDKLFTPLNNSLMTWINILLITSFVLVVVAGISGFLWARHRKLNDPLNYRENMMQGYFNECYETRSGELISDDESDRDSDIQL